MQAVTCRNLRNLETLRQYEAGQSHPETRGGGQLTGQAPGIDGNSGAWNLNNCTVGGASQAHCQRRSYHAFAAYDTYLDASPIFSADDQRNHAVIGKVCVVNLLSQIMQHPVMFKIDVLEIRADQVVFTIRDGK